MKKIKLVTGLVGVCAATLLGSSALAANVDAQPTKGTIQFGVDVNETGDIIKPDEEGLNEEIITGLPGASGKGPLRIQFVPDLSFGTKEGITSDKQTQNAALLDYQGNTIPNGKVPPFVQVTNNSGDTVNTWTLYVKGTPFAETDGTGGIVSGGDVLTAAYIDLKASTLTTTKGTTDDAKLFASGQTDTKIPMTGTGNGIVVLKSTANTNGKQVSNVFETNYQYGKTYTGDATGVEFVKPAGQAAKKDVTYKSTLTWSLVDAK